MGTGPQETIKFSSTEALNYLARFLQSNLSADETIQRAAISAASNGDNTLVSAVTGKKIKVLGAVLVAANSVVARFESGAGGTALSGQMSLIAGTPLVLPVMPAGYHWMETAAGALLNLELGGAVQVSGVLVYVTE